MNDVNRIAAEESLVRSWAFDEGGQAVEMGPAALPELPPNHELRSEYLKAGTPIKSFKNEITDLTRRMESAVR